MFFVVFTSDDCSYKPVQVIRYNCSRRLSGDVFCIKWPCSNALIFPDPGSYILDDESKGAERCSVILKERWRNVCACVSKGGFRGSEEAQSPPFLRDFTILYLKGRIFVLLYKYWDLFIGREWCKNRTDFSLSQSATRYDIFTSEKRRIRHLIGCTIFFTNETSRIRNYVSLARKPVKTLPRKSERFVDAGSKSLINHKITFLNTWAVSREDEKL